MTKRNMRLFCVFSGILGNRILSNRLEKVLTEMDGVEPQFVYISPEDFAETKIPAWTRLSNSFEAEYVTKSVIERTNVKQFDAIFINGLELSLPLYNIIKQYPSVIAFDATVDLAQKQMRYIRKSSLKRLKSYSAQFLMRERYKRIFSVNNLFFPMSNWCADSLVKSYGVKADDCYVSYVPIDFAEWPHKRSFSSGKQKILFIGNDFFRKGGDWVLEIYQKHLVDKSVLTIISNDPYIKELKYDGVTFLSGISYDEIKRHYMESDIFVFPTKKEYLGVVVTEALASGLPVIVRDTGAISEFVIKDQTGILMPYDSEKEEWANAIMKLIDDEERKKQFLREARRIAVEKFNIEDFKKKVNKIVNRLSTLQG